MFQDHWWNLKNPDSSERLEPHLRPVSLEAQAASGVLSSNHTGTAEARGLKHYVFRIFFTHLLELQTQEHRQRQMLMRMWNNRNCHSLLEGMQNGTTPLEDSWAVFNKTSNTFTI